MRRLLIILAILATSLLVAVPGLKAQTSKAEQAMEQAARHYVQHGNILMTESKEEAAVVSFRKAIELAPNLAEAHSLLGTALARLGRFAEAEMHLKKAVALKPDYAEGYYYLGLFYQSQGRQQEAQQAFQKAKQYQR